MPLKYDGDIAAIPDCPAAHYASRDTAAFRFVFREDMPRSFVPPLKQNPNRALKMEAVQRCSGWALSFFISREAAISAFAKLTKVNQKVYKTVGDSIAFGELRESDGLSAEPDDEGHFDLHEFEAVSLHERFAPSESLL